MHKLAPARMEGASRRFLLASVLTNVAVLEKPGCFTMEPNKHTGPWRQGSRKRIQVKGEGDYQRSHCLT